MSPAEDRFRFVLRCAYCGLVLYQGDAYPRFPRVCCPRCRNTQLVPVKPNVPRSPKECVPEAPEAPLYNAESPGSSPGGGTTIDEAGPITAEQAAEGDVVLRGFTCVECGHSLGKCDPVRSGYELRTEEYTYWAAHPKEYEAMRVQWPQYEFSKWDHAQFMREHS